MSIHLELLLKDLEHLKNKVMRFKNLGFIQHPHVKDAIMAQVFTDSGKRVSIVCGKGLYSSSRDGNKAE